MKYITNHHKSIALFLAMLLLFQSCIVINKKSTVTKASGQDIHRIKVKTNDNKKYIFDWIDERNGNIVNIRNTERIIIDKEKVKQIVISDPKPLAIPLDSMTIFSGKASFLIEDRYGRYGSQEFIQFEDLGYAFKCYQMISEDTLTMVIPLEKIDKIKVASYVATIGVNLLIGLGVITGLGYLYFSTASFF